MGKWDVLKKTDLSDRGQFIGATPRSISVTGATLTEIVHERARALPSHAHRDPYLALLVTGRYEDRLGARQRTFVPTDASFSPPAFEHRDWIGAGGATFFAVSFAPDAGSMFTERESLWATPAKWSGSGPVQALTRLYVDFRCHPETLDPLGVESRLFEVWSEIAVLSRDERHVPEWLDGARARLHDEFASAPGIVELAADAGVHPTYFTRAFRRRFGLGPAEYRGRLRVAAACRLLAGQRPLRDIAITLGYADQAHLTRDVRARVGMSPAAYRHLVSGPRKYPPSAP